MDLLSQAISLQSAGVRAVEELFSELHGWSNAVHLNADGPPREGLLAWFVDGTDSIGILITDKPNVRAEIWALLFDGSDVAYSDAQRIINIEASIYLNYGWELVGNETKGYAVYEEGTPMERTYRYFGEEYDPPLSLRYLNTSHYTNMEHYI
jgi:hypothetical protein